MTCYLLAAYIAACIEVHETVCQATGMRPAAAQIQCRLELRSQAARARNRRMMRRCEGKEDERKSVSDIKFRDIHLPFVGFLMFFCVCHHYLT